MIMPNKGERNRLTKLKFKRRLKRMGLLGPGGIINPNLYCYKNQGKPCSCIFCSKGKYNRKIKHKKKNDTE